MKRYLFLLIMLSVSGICFSVFAQNRITVSLEKFDKLSVMGRVDLELVPSESDQMSITMKTGEFDDLKYNIKSGELQIKSKTINQDNDIYITLPYKDLTSIEAGGGAVINSRDSLKSEDIIFQAHTGGKIELEIAAINIEVKVTQGSDIILYGTVETQEVTANTGGNYLAYSLASEEAVVKSATGAQAKVNATRKIEANAVSKGFIGYLGKPGSTIIKTSLGGKIANFESQEDADIY